MVGPRYWMEPEFQGKPSLLRHIPIAGRVMMTRLSPQSIKFMETVYHVPAQCYGKNIKKWPFPQGLDYETEDKPVC